MNSLGRQKQIKQTILTEEVRQKQIISRFPLVELIWTYVTLTL